MDNNEVKKSPVAPPPPPPPVAPPPPPPPKRMESTTEKINTSVIKEKAPEPSASPSKSNNSNMLIGALVVLLGVGYFFMSGDDRDKKAAKAPVAKQTVTEVSKPVSDSKVAIERVGYIKGTDVSIRKGPSTNTERLGFVNTNDKVKILDIVNKDGEIWYHISFDGKDGYVFGKYVVEQTQSAETLKARRLAYKNPENGVEDYILLDTYVTRGDLFSIDVETYAKGKPINKKTYVFNKKTKHYGRIAGTGELEKLGEVQKNDFAVGVWNAVYSK